MNELALFAGAAGGILGGKLLGWRTVCAVEWEQYPACVLVARQNDGLLPPFPIWDDVQTFDGKPWQGIVDVVSGGFPCQDISAAGKGAGIDGKRSGMWQEMARIICEVRPKYAFIENSPMLTTRGLGTVLADLAKMGFDAEWGVLSAADVGANHLRERMWIVGKSTKQHGFFPHSQHDRIGRWEQQQESIEKKIDISNTNFSISGYRPNVEHISNKERKSSKARGKVIQPQNWETYTNNFKSSSKSLANPRCKLRNEGNSTNLVANQTKRASSPIFNQPSGSRFGHNSNWWEIEPNLGRMADGVAAGVDRLKAIGNGQVPLCAATAWNILKGRLDDRIRSTRSN